MAQTSLRSIIGKSEMDELLSNRESLNKGLELLIDNPALGWGIHVERVEIKDVALPETMKRSMSRQAEAERERRARIITADGEYQASRKLAAGGGVMARHPAALQLRLLQTVVEVAAEKNSTLVLPFPVELLRFLERSTPPAGTGSTPAAGPEDGSDARPTRPASPPRPADPALTAPVPSDGDDPALTSGGPGPASVEPVLHTDSFRARRCRPDRGPPRVRTLRTVSARSGDPGTARDAAPSARAGSGRSRPRRRAGRARAGRHPSRRGAGSVGSRRRDLDPERRRRRCPAPALHGGAGWVQEFRPPDDRAVEAKRGPRTGCRARGGGEWAQRWSRQGRGRGRMEG